MPTPTSATSSTCREQPKSWRIAAQAAKQVIFQKVRDAERENIYNEYVERTGELVTGLVKRFERGDMIVDLGRTEGLLPRREQSRAEHYNIGDRIRVVITDVLKVSRGPQIVISRVAPDLLIRLFEMEVPEIYDGTVVIKGAVREGGDRAKVAVHSLEADVDAVGACVGMRGSRVQSIIRELRGEKIDIVQWAGDFQQYAINALKPARVNRVTVIDGEERHLEVIVDEDQLSLAIGKRGQNVRLAGKLLNAKIDIKSEADKKREVEQALVQMEIREESIEQLAGVGAKTAEALVAAGFKTVGDVAAADLDAMTAVPGIGVKIGAKILASAAELLATLPEVEEPAATSDASEAAEGESEVDPALVLASLTSDDAEGTPAEETEFEMVDGGPATEEADEEAEPVVEEADEEGEPESELEEVEETAAPESVPEEIEECEEPAADEQEPETVEEPELA